MYKYEYVIQTTNNYIKKKTCSWNWCSARARLSTCCRGSFFVMILGSFFKLGFLSNFSWNEKKNEASNRVGNFYFILVHQHFCQDTGLLATKKVSVSHLRSETRRELNGWGSISSRGPVVDDWTMQIIHTIQCTPYLQLYLTRYPNGLSVPSLTY